MRLPEVKLTRRTLVAGGAALVVAGAGVAVGVTRCSRGAADVPAEPSAGAEATDSAADSKLGGKLSLYTSCPEDLVNAVVARFSQDAGVTVATVRAPESEIASRVADETASGDSGADVIWGGECLWRWGTDGLTAAPEPTQREVGAFALAEDLAADVKAAPASYADLLDASLAVRVALCAPQSCEAGWLHLVAMLSEAAGTVAGGALGDDVSWAFVQSLLDAGVVVCASEDEAVQALLDGSVDVALVTEQRARQLARRTGQTGVAWPESAVGTSRSLLGVAKGCRNAEQVEAFVEFLTGHDGQQVVANALARPASDEVQVVDGDDGAPADDVLEVVTVDADGAADQREELLATWAQVVAGEWSPAAEGEAAAEGEEEATAAEGATAN